MGERIADFLDDVVHEITRALETKFPAYEFHAPTLVYFKGHSNADITRISFRKRQCRTSPWVKMCNVWVSNYPEMSLLDREYWVYFCDDNYFFVMPNTCDCECRLKQHIAERVVGETTQATIDAIAKAFFKSTSKWSKF